MTNMLKFFEKIYWNKHFPYVWQHDVIDEPGRCYGAALSMYDVIDGGLFCYRGLEKAADRTASEWGGPRGVRQGSQHSERLSNS